MKYGKHTKEELIKRFEDRVMPVPYSGCWIWMLGLTSAGYGQFGIGTDKSVLAHRFSFEAFIGEIPKGMLVCHHCDTPACCNPDHLFLGSHKDNMHDMIKKGRNNNPSGILCFNSKLTESSVSDIRDSYKSGTSQGALAKKYNINQSTVSLIINKKTWREPFY